MSKNKRSVKQTRVVKIRRSISRTKLAFVVAIAVVGVILLKHSKATPLNIVDYTKRVGLTVATSDGRVHSFGKPCVADLNGDGLNDIVWSNHYEATWDVYMGQPDGTWVEDTRNPWVKKADSHGCAIADFDHNGKLDIFGSIGACEGTCSHAEQLWLQNDNGYTNEAVNRIVAPYTYDRSRPPVVLDANKDGWTDIFVPADASTKSKNRLLINNGNTLVATTAGVEANGGRTYCALAADLDGDGNTDLAACREKKFDLWRNDGTGHFTPNTFGMGAVAPLARGVEHVDMNGDGAKDIVLVTSTSAQVRLNRGGSYPIVDWNMPILYGIDVTTPDINGDGAKDIYIVQTSSHQDPNSKSADMLFVNTGDMTNWQRVPVPQAKVGKGDTAEVLPNFGNSGADAVLVSNGFYSSRGPRQVLAMEGLLP